MQRITIQLTEKEREGLEYLVAQDMRPPKATIRWLLREELKRREAWPAELRETRAGERVLSCDN